MGEGVWSSLKSFFGLPCLQMTGTGEEKQHFSKVQSSLGGETTAVSRSPTECRVHSPGPQLCKHAGSGEDKRNLFFPPAGSCGLWYLLSRNSGFFLLRNDVFLASQYGELKTNAGYNGEVGKVMSQEAGHLLLGYQHYQAATSKLLLSEMACADYR